MKIKNLLLLAVALSLCICCTKETPESQISQSQDSGNAFAGRTFYASFASDGKAQLDADYQSYWSSEDTISVFMGPVNERYRFTGITGAVKGKFVKDDQVQPGEGFSKVYAVYPYRNSNASSEEGVLAVSIPSEQRYTAHSYDPRANVMLAVTEDIDDENLYFRDACSYLRLNLYGGDVVTSVSLTGNNGEILAGGATMTAEEGKIPVLSMTGDAETVTVSLGDEGIQLLDDSSKALEIWFTIPPVTFEKGFTVNITNSFGQTMTKKVSSKVAISRNVAKKINPVKVSMSSGTDFLSFSLTDGVKEFKAFEISDTLVRIMVPNHPDFLGSAIAKYTTNPNAVVTVDGVPQVSEETANDFSHFEKPLRYTVTSVSGKSSTHTVVLFDLPTLVIETPGHKAITSKTVWTENCTIKLYETDGTITDLGSASVRGRGNSSWTYPKHPYTFKLDKKPKTLLGMPGDKRWDLLCNYLGYTCNAAGHEVARRAEDIEWEPRCRFVEVILNGVHLSAYTLIEHIKISKDRVNITELAPTDLEYPAISGGYLIELDEYFDDQYKFRSSIYNLPVNLKSPDENVPAVQMDYIKNFFTEMEESLTDPEKFEKREFDDYIDLKSFADVWIARAISSASTNTDFKVPKSVRVYKGRDGIDSKEGTVSKFKGGPCWDFDGCTFKIGQLANMDAWYYKELFKDPTFVKLVKDKWPAYKANLEGLGKYPQSIYDWFEDLAVEIANSVERDLVMWPNAVNFYQHGQTVKTQITDTRVNLPKKIQWMDEQIKALKVNYNNKTGNTEDYNSQKDDTGYFNFGF